MSVLGVIHVVESDVKEIAVDAQHLIRLYQDGSWVSVLAKEEPAALAWLERHIDVHLASEADSGPSAPDAPATETTPAPVPEPASTPTDTTAETTTTDPTEQAT